MLNEKNQLRTSCRLHLISLLCLIQTFKTHRGKEVFRISHVNVPQIAVYSSIHLQFGYENLLELL